MQWMLFLSIFLLLMDGVFGAETDEAMSVMEGDSVTLHTNLTEILNDDTLLWLFGPNEFVISQITRKEDLTSFFVTDDVRFNGRFQVDQNTGSLTIRNTRIRHSGQYKLRFSREKTTTKTFNVTVIGVVDETGGVKSVSVMEGESVTLQNYVTAIQRDDLIVWRFGDKGILLAKIDGETNETSVNIADERFKGRLELDQTGSLIITDTRTEHAGLYELQIRGRESSQQFLVSVSGVFVETDGAKLVSVMEGDSVTLNPDLTQLQRVYKILWTFGAQGSTIVEVNRNYNIYESDMMFAFRVNVNRNASLTIRNIRTSHSGLYVAKISHSTGTSYKKFGVIVYESPSVIDAGEAEIKSMSVRKGNPVTLETFPEVFGYELMLWGFGDEGILIAKYDTEATVASLYDAVDGKFRGRLHLHHQTGALTIRNTRTTDSGLYQLKIMSGHTSYKKFSVTVSGE
ncbi:uncharacterized protein LOC131530388 [Onychostoma macrolepis]|uniref:uncharacterized protein LOC131530388 n=1 Tax=Onychostoma macrolepis TaxID=369639 RepID=UPI00272B3CF5|nr:uncharacterized protein LOC131530388 [Onychostoma macrolepis]